MKDDIETMLKRANMGDEGSLHKLADALIRYGYGGAYRILSERWQALVETIAGVTDWQHDFNGECPTPSNPLARDPECQVCNLLMVAERADPAVWRQSQKRVVSQAAVVKQHSEHYEAERRRRYRAEKRVEQLEEELERLRRQLG